MRDGASMIGGLLFTAFSSANFGQNAKSWRLFADYINNVGITLDLLAPLSQSLFLPLICLSSVFKSLCGIAAGAAGAVISEHWGSVHGNIAEVNSKNGAQHTAVSLLGLLVSIPFASFASRSPRVMWSVYAVLTIIHVVSNYCAMRTLQLRSINISRGKILVSQFMKAVDSVMKLYLNPVTNDNVAMVKQIVVDENASVYTLSNIARTEPILKLLLPRFDSIGNRITSGISMCTDSTHGTVKIWASPGEVAQYLSQSDTKLPGTIDEMLQRSCSTGRNYTLFYDKGVHTKGHGQVFVCFSDLCTPNTVDQLEALLHAHLLLRFMGNIELSEKATTSLYPLLLSTLKSHRWDTHRIMFRPRNARAYSIKNT